MAINPTVGTRTSLTVTGLSTLASGTYAVSAAYNCNTNKPVDVVVEVSVATNNTPASNNQLLVFVKESLDGSNYRSGPESGTSDTDRPDLVLLGRIPINSATNTHAGMFSIAEALGYVPHSFKIVVKNEIGVALTSGSAYTSEISIP